jgi:hypothetical protein
MCSSIIYYYFSMIFINIIVLHWMLFVILWFCPRCIVSYENAHTFFMMLIQLKLNVTCFSKFLVISIFHDRNVDIPFILTCGVVTKKRKTLFDYWFCKTIETSFSKNKSGFSLINPELHNLLWNK